MSSLPRPSARAKEQFVGISRAFIPVDSSVLVLYCVLVVYEDGDSEDLMLSQVLPVLAQASPFQGQARGDEQKPSRREGKEEAVTKRTRPLSEAANNATEQQRGKGVRATQLPNDFTCAEPQVAPDTVSQSATHGRNRSCHQQPSAACCEGGRGARRRSSILCCREVWC
jgi:hypothetical protein